MSDGIDPQKMYVDNIIQHEANYVGIIKMMKGSVGSIVELKAIDTSDTTKYVDGTMILLRGVGIYYFDASSVSTDDGSCIIEPSNGRGRWFAVNIDLINNISDLAEIKAPLADPTFTGTPKATSNTDYATAQLRNIIASTTDLTAGTSVLASGTLYVVFQ
jgi:hypothetical protein